MKIQPKNGFTLVELLITLLMSSVVVFSLYSVSKKQQDTYVAQDQVVAMQDNLRAAMLLPIKEIRMAGYDPTGTANATITTATSTTLRFSMDLNGDRDTNDSGEDITYSLYTADGIQKLGRKNPTQNMPVAEYITNLEFYYTMADGSQTLTPATLNNIRAVQMTVLAQTMNAAPDSTAVSSFTTASGVIWTIPAGFKGRMEIVTVQCRNMGL